MSNATVGITIARGISTVTIVDDETTRQFSISDTSATEGDHTAHYRGPFVEGTPGGSSFNLPAFGPDGNFYSVALAGPSAGGIDRYNGTTGAFIDHVVPSGRLNAARDIGFSGDFLYVGEESNDDVLRFNAATGAFDRIFVTPGSGGINGPHGLTFGPDSNNDGIPELYVSGRDSFNVVRYDGATGQPLGTYVTSGSGGLSWPEGLTFDPSGTYLYVTSTGSNQVLKYDALTGAYVGVGASAGLSAPKGVKFGPDGLLYVASANNNRIMRFNATGTYVDDYVPAGSGGMTYLSRLVFGPDGDLYVSVGGPGAEVHKIYRFGTNSETLFSVSLSQASTLPVSVNYATADGTALEGRDYTATSGTITFEPWVISKIIRVPILDDTPPTTEPTETFTVNLSNPVGGVIADSQGIASILDNDPFTKFYVVNDATTDRTYEYGTTGASVENYALAAGNTAPRGAASTTMGTKVWVVDANKSVYTYDTSGALQGSWAAGGLQTNAQLEGIATNGADVWLVDDRTDKVYRYAKAAPLTNGSPVPISSFSLNRANTSPKDIVTDGNYLWVVNDSLIDKVFKYTIGGTFVGSWTITTSGASSPTGITLDPSKPSHIWIVDSGTDRVYQYNAAVELTSGNKSANSSWALAAGNTNPQGIADPPPPVVGSVGKTLDPQSSSIGPVPMPWFSGSTANVGFVSLQPVQSKAPSTDQFMSVLGLTFEQPKASVNVGRSRDVASTKSIDRSAGIDAEMQDHDMEDLIGLLALDLRR